MTTDTYRKTIVYIAMSLDGYIASANGDISFLSLVEQEGEDYGYEKFNSQVDVVILGRKTYDKILSFGIDFPHSDKKRVYVLTHQKIENSGNVIFYQDDVTDLVAKLKQDSGKNIYIDGGAEIINLLRKNNLIDEYVISIIPVLLGNGIPLFQTGFKQRQLQLLKTYTFNSGLVQLHYLTLPLS